MATLRTETGDTIGAPAEIDRALAPLGVRLARWPVDKGEGEGEGEGNGAELRALLGKPGLADSEKDQVLAGLDRYFQTLRTEAGYQSRDLIVIHGGIPGLDDLLAKFERCHTHADDEVRYIVDGEGVFGFVLPDGSQVALTIEAEEYINVPAGTEHWFYLTDKRRIKAVRYFTTTEGWTPEYTDTEIRIAR